MWVLMITILGANTSVSLMPECVYPKQERMTQLKAACFCSLG